jgi:hypothetical protein
MAGRVFVGFVWMSENLPIKEVPKATASVFVIDALCLFWSSLYFRLISKHWAPLFICAVLGSSIATYLFIIQPESPKFYYSVGEFEKTRMVLT